MAVPDQEVDLEKAIDLVEEETLTPEEKEDIKEWVRKKRFYWYTCNWKDWSWKKFIAKLPPWEKIFWGSAIRKINDLKRWKNTVFVLTFANAMVLTLESQGKSGDQLEAGLNAHIAEWQEHIKAALTELKLRLTEKLLTIIIIIKLFLQAIQ